MSGHSIIAPSAASVWSACPGSVLMKLAFPEEGPRPAAEEGTKCHELAERFLKKFQSAGPVLPPREKIVEEGYTPEMYDAAELFARAVGEFMHGAKVFGGENLGIEREVKAPSIHELSGGTVDAFVYNPKTRELLVADLKFGRLVVEVLGNKQLACYVAGVIAELGLTDPDTKITTCIVQPRAYHSLGSVRTVTRPLSYYVNEIADLRLAAERALAPDAETVSGSHCRYCPAKASCPAALKAAGTLFEATGEGIPHGATPEELGALYTNVLRAAEHLKFMESALKEQLESAIRSGGEVPGYQLETRSTPLAWTKTEEEIDALGEALGVELTKRKAITPTQAIKAGVDKGIVAQYAERSQKTELKKVKTNEAAAIFGA